MKRHCVRALRKLQKERDSATQSRHKWVKARVSLNFGSYFDQALLTRLIVNYPSRESYERPAHPYQGIFGQYSGKDKEGKGSCLLLTSRHSGLLVLIHVLQSRYHSCCYMYRG